MRRSRHSIAGRSNPNGTMIKIDEMFTYPLSEAARQLIEREIFVNTLRSEFPDIVIRHDPRGNVDTPAGSVEFFDITAPGRWSHSITVEWEDDYYGISTDPGVDGPSLPFEAPDSYFRGRDMALDELRRLIITGALTDRLWELL